MPSREKTFHFLFSAVLTTVSIGLLGFGMSAQWAEANMECARQGDALFNGTAVLSLSLFAGFSDRRSCPGFDNGEGFQVLPQLVLTGGAPLVLHGLVVCLLALCLVCSSGSILISLYNGVSNPYQTYMGPIGVYTCSSLSACLSFVILIVFVVNLNVCSIAEDLVQSIAGDLSVDLRNKRVEMGLGYCLLIPYLVLSLLAIALIYKYQHAAYTHQREQQRPTEDAPKEIMMY